jgi:hypothetical protein
MSPQAVQVNCIFQSSGHSAVKAMGVAGLHPRQYGRCSKKYDLNSGNDDQRSIMIVLNGASADIGFPAQHFRVTWYV